MGEFAALLDLNLRQLSAVLSTGRLSLEELEQNQCIGLIELLTMRLIDECEELSAEDWVVCSAATDYVFCVAEKRKSIDHEEGVIRRLNISAALLRRVAPRSEVDLLAPDHVVDLLLRELPVSVDEARDMAARWQSLEIDQIRRLRLVKNLLSPVVGIGDVIPRHTYDSRLKAWIGIFSSLP
ncbi:hypothetical protein ABT340_31470 [Streptosporangium sp. NPDC000239]|uniref:hypothetical protein n=1 Tax=Streptosporangium sp. NPDC000239 TaxID=3154248 RepID=UPI003323F9A8